MASSPVMRVRGLVNTNCCLSGSECGRPTGFAAPEMLRLAPENFLVSIDLASHRGRACRNVVRGRVVSEAAPDDLPSRVEQGAQQVIDSLFLPVPGFNVSHLPLEKSSKVTVVGVGNVGMACAQTILTQDLTDVLALVDVQADKLRVRHLHSHRGSSPARRFVIADKLDVNAQNVHAYIVGEHGDSSVPLWSSISVGGVPIIDFLNSHGPGHTKQDLQAIHRTVVGGAYEVIKLKGYTSWAIGYSIASLTKSLLRNQRRIHPVSVLAKGFHGIDQAVFLSLPAQLGRAGVLSVVNSQLNHEESAQIRESARTLWEVQSRLDDL